MSLEGERLGEFEILEHLGQGGMGAVYKARQASLGRIVALKTVHTSFAGDQDYLARFRQEAKMAAGLNHPNLVQVYSAGDTNGLPWFAMEYVEGETAKVRLKRQGRLNLREAIVIAVHVATALEYGWNKAALIHRDIKPDNIFLSEDGKVKLGDLGLAKSGDATQGLTVTGLAMGTPHYISPEQVEGMKHVDLRADIYSLGCTLYHLLSGQAPYDGDHAVAIMLKHVNAPAPDLRAAWPECPKELAAVVEKMVRKRPAERHQSHSEVISDLLRIYDAGKAPARAEAVRGGAHDSAETVGERSQRELPSHSAREKSRATFFASLGVLAIAIGSGIFFVLTPKSRDDAKSKLPGQEQVTPAPVKAREIGEPLVASAAVSGSEKDAYEAWFKKYRLDLTDPKMLDADPDGDGFTNREEFLANTNPLDPTSHPAYTDPERTLQLKEYSEARLPVTLESIDGEKAHLKRTDGDWKTGVVKVGDTVRGLGLKVLKIESRWDVDKNGERVDLSQVTLEDTSTKEKFVLTGNLPAKTSASYAVLVANNGVASFKVRRGATFVWPEEGGTEYKVIDMSQDRVVLQQVDNKKMWTVPRVGSDAGGGAAQPKASEK